MYFVDHFPIYILYPCLCLYLHFCFFYIGKTYRYKKLLISEQHIISLRTGKRIGNGSCGYM